MRAAVRNSILIGLPLAALAVGLVLLAGASSETVKAKRSDWDRLAGQMAAAWPKLQRPNGSFPDFTDGEVPRGTGRDTRYGDSVLALALLQRGLRRGDRRLVDSAVDGLVYSIRGKRRRWLQRYKPSVFEAHAVAAGYNLLRSRRPGHPVFKRNKRLFQRWLLRVRPVSTILRIPNTTRFSNHYLVEALEVFELQRTGLRTRNRRALLGPGLGRAVRIYRRMINVGIPRIERMQRQRRRGVTTFLISDPPDYPLAYQGLALGYYAQAMRMIGGGSAAARATLRRAVNASWLLTAPDGELGWFGRSMAESWAQAGTALGAETAANRPGASTRERLRSRAVREAALRRLRDAYGNGPRGYRFIPALKVDDRLGARALEPYAGSPSFGGLTLMLLNWTLDEMPRRERPRGSLAATRNFQATLSRGQSKFAVVRRGRSWFAVKQGQSRRRYPGDLRYDFGLVHLKRAAGRGWRDIVPLRPLTYAKVASAGPLLIRGSRRGYPWGTRTRVRRGTVTVFGGWKVPGEGGSWMRYGTRFRYVPTACGVRLSFRARRGDRIEYSSFLRAYRQRPRLERAGLTDSRQRVTASPRPNALHVDRRAYHSASDPSLRRARMRFRVRRARTISITVCER